MICHIHVEIVNMVINFNDRFVLIYYSDLSWDFFFWTATIEKRYRK